MFHYMHPKAFRPRAFRPTDNSAIPVTSCSDHAAVPDHTSRAQHHLLSIYGSFNSFMPYRKHFSFAIQRFRLLYSQAVYHRLLLLHCSNQILHHSLHRLDLIGTVSITAAEQQGIIQRSLCRVKSHGLNDK